MTGPLYTLFVSALVTFFVVIDPPGCAPIFASLTRGTSSAERLSMAIRSVLVAACILLFFAIAGEAFLRSMGIGLSAFRIAGGIMLFLIALEMVFEKRTERRENRAAEVMTRPHEDISIFPMAIPMIAGPGSIATAMLLTSHRAGVIEIAVVLAAMLVILLVTLLALLAAGPLIRLLGEGVEAVITRLLGVILAALAAQFVLDGVRATFG